MAARLPLAGMVLDIFVLCSVVNAQSSVARARNAYLEASREARRIKEIYEIHNKRLRQIRERAEQLPATRSELEYHRRTFVTEAAEAEEKLPDLKSELAKSTAALTKSASELETARQKLAEEQKTYDSAHAAAVAEFEAGDPFPKLLAEHAAAQQNLIDARNASAAALEQSAEYIEAQKRFAELDARVRELRQAGSSQAEVLAIASRERLEAQSLIGRLQKEHTANDTNLREAEQRLARAEKALADERANFEAVYATLPTVQPQRQRLQELSAAVTDYSRSHENVLRQVSSFQKAIGEAEDKIARKERSVREMDRRINAIAVELEQLEKELRIMENNVPKLKQQFDAAHEREVRMYNAYLQAKKADDERTASGKKQ